MRTSAWRRGRGPGRSEEVPTKLLLGEPQAVEAVGNAHRQPNPCNRLFPKGLGVEEHQVGSAEALVDANRCDETVVTSGAAVGHKHWLLAHHLLRVSDGRHEPPALKVPLGQPPEVEVLTAFHPACIPEPHAVGRDEVIANAAELGMECRVHLRHPQRPRVCIDAHFAHAHLVVGAENDLLGVGVGL